MSRTRRVAGLIAGPVVGLLVAGLIGSVSRPTPPSCAVHLSLVVSVEKLAQMREISQAYAKKRVCADDPVRISGGGPGSVLDGLADGWDPAEHAGLPRPDAWSPNADFSLGLLRLRAPETLADEPVRSLNTTPMVLAIPRTVADALTKAFGEVTWQTVLDMAADPALWQQFSQGRWGPLRLGRTNPTLSTMGLQTLVAEFAHAAGVAKPADLTAAAIADQGVRRRVEAIEARVPHYGETTLDYLCNLARADQRKQALGYVTVVPVEEKSVIEYNDGRQRDNQGGACPYRHAPAEKLVPLYPPDGVFVTGSPLAVLATADADQRRLAADFAEFARSEAGQRIFRRDGFRDVSMRLDPHPATPGLVTRLSPRDLPPAPVIAAVRAAWDEVRRPARILILLDMSGSMACSVDDQRDGDHCAEPTDQRRQRFGLARDAVAQALGGAALGSRDRVGLHTFGGPGPPCVDRTKGLVSAVDVAAVLPDATEVGGETPLYRCLLAAQSWLAGRPDHAGYINAVVVLTDGENDYAHESLRTTADGLAATYGRAAVRVFPVAYVYRELDPNLLTLAGAAGGTLYRANDPKAEETRPDNIATVVRKLISAF